MKINTCDYHQGFGCSVASDCKASLLRIAPLGFLNPLGSSKLNDTAYALLLAASESSKAVQSYAQEPRFDRQSGRLSVREKALRSTKIHFN